MKSAFTWEDIALLKKYPHLIGHMAGMKDLTPLHSKWIKDIHDAKTDKALMASRSSYKTSSISIIGSVYRLMWNPDQTIFIIRKSYSAAAEVVKAILNVMESPAIYALLLHCWFADENNNIPNKAFWKFSVRKDGQLNLSIRKTHSPESNITAIGLDSSITGKHCDFALLDDFVTFQDRLYKAEREYTKTILGEIRANIVKKTGYSAMIGTKWHEQDAWKDIEVEGIQIDKYPYQMLSFISEEEIAKARKTQTPALFACNYELSWESGEDMIFSEPNKGVWDRRNVTDIAAHIDAAYGGKDTCALSIAGRLPDKKFCVVGFVFHGHVKDWIPTIIQKMQIYGARRLYAENNADKGYTLDMIKAHPLADTYDFWTTSYVENTHKQTKIATVLFDVWNKIEFDEGTEDEYLDQITSWNETTREGDDCPDSLASLMREARFASNANYMNLYS